MLPSRLQQKERRNLGSEMLWRVLLALDQGLNRQHETWIFTSHVATFMALSVACPSYFVAGNDFLCMGSAEIHLGSDVKIPAAAGEPRLRRAGLGLHGSVVSLPLLSARETPKIFLRLLRHEDGHKETECRLKKTGTVLVFDR